MNNMLFSKVKLLLVLVFLFTGTTGTIYSKKELRKISSQNSTTSTDKAPLYLPKAEYVKLITFGFEKFTSDILWFRTINYFGKHMQKQESIPWFAHMCDLVTDLNPLARAHYESCSSLLSWVAKDAKSSVKLLNRAISHEPSYWRYYYLRGFNYWYFLENNTKAREDFLEGSKLPDAPIFLTNLAGRLLASEDGPNQAILFLKNLVEQTSDPEARKALEKNLKLAYVSRDLDILNDQAEKYKEHKGSTISSLQDLLDEKLISYIPKDPYGELYTMNEKGEIVSNQGKKGLIFAGKTAKTGLAKFE